MRVSARVVPWALGALLLVLALMSYGPALRGGLVWDDAAHVTRPELQSWVGLSRIWTEPGATQQYYPVIHSAFWIEHRLWGDATFGYHFTNVLEHTADAWLFGLFLLAVGRIRPAGALAAALLFAIHPICVNSVAWISEQKNTLSLLFYLCAGLAYFRFLAQGRRRQYLLAFVCFDLALGSKSVTATFPAAVLVVLWWRDGRVNWRRETLRLLPFFVLGIAVGLFTAWVERTLIGASGAAFALTAGQRVLLAGRVAAFYLEKLFWPNPVMFFYPRWNVAGQAAGWWGWLLGEAVLTWLLWSLRRRTRGPFAAWLFFLGSLFPALGFFNVYPFRFSYVADHFAYLPALGIFAAVGAAAGRGLDLAARPLRFATAAALCLLLIAFPLLDRRESGNYRDSETLYRATLALNPNAWVAQSNLGVALTSQPGRQAEALALCQEAVRLEPDEPEAHNNLGNALLANRAPEAEAQAEFRAALALEPRFPEARLNLANSQARSPGQMTAALANYTEVLREQPNFAEAHFCYANALASRSDTRQQAITEYTAALRLRPSYYEAHANLAGVLATQPGDLPQALREYETALRLAPNEAQTHYSYAVTLDRIPGRTKDAVREYAETLRLNPRYVQADNNLAVLYARQGRFDLAREHWEAALRVDPAFEPARRNLALLDQREPVERMVPMR